MFSIATACQWNLPAFQPRKPDSSGSPMALVSSLMKPLLRPKTGESIEVLALT
jgi:hypothetical protein